MSKNFVGLHNHVAAVPSLTNDDWLSLWLAKCDTVKDLELGLKRLKVRRIRVLGHLDTSTGYSAVCTLEVESSQRREHQIVGVCHSDGASARVHGCMGERS